MSIYINKLLLKLPGPDSTLELAEPEARSTPALLLKCVNKLNLWAGCFRLDLVSIQKKKS